MTADPERPTHDLRQLVTEAEQLRAALSLFVSHAAKRSEDHEAFHDGVRRAATDRAPWTS